MLRGLIVLVAFCAVCRGVTVPVGTEIRIRLTSPVSSETAQSGQAVHAVVIAPVLAGSFVAIPLHAEIDGVVKSAAPANAQENRRAALSLDFNELRGAAGPVHLDTLLASIDNAREALAEDGTIQGPVPSELLTARIDQGLGKLQQRFAGLAGILETAKGVLLKDADPNIVYDAGVEMTLKLAKPVDLKPPPVDAVPGFPNFALLSALVNRQPFQTYAVNPPVKSDITNLMFIGSKERLEAAFAAAGWSNAEALNSISKFQTARAIIEQRGFKEAPVSTLILDDRRPDLVYEKGNNTFAARHHLRIWRSQDTLAGEPVWLSSSTHDTGIDFSQQNMTFIHRIDPKIDSERSKVVNDLLFAGSVRSLALVNRQRVPRNAKNATGDNLETDGAMAVIRLK